MNDKRNKTLVMTALIVALGSLTIGYAALSQVLKFQTDVNLVSSNSKWEISFRNPSEPIISGDAVAGDITVSNTHVNISDVILKAPGASVSYIVELKNNGNIDAKLSSIYKTHPIIIGTGSSKETDEILVENNYRYEIKYNDGDAISVYDRLDAGEMVKIRITISYNPQSGTFPKNNVTIKELGAVLVYEEA